MIQFARAAPRNYETGRTHARDVTMWTPTQRPASVSVRRPVHDAKLAAGLSVLGEVVLLKDEWDGDGSVAPSPETVENAARLLREFVARTELSPEIFANDTGTISFEWERERGTAHLEIGKNRFSMFIQPRSGASRYFDGDFSATDGIVAKMGSTLLAMLANAEPASARFVFPAYRR